MAITSFLSREIERARVKRPRLYAMLGDDMGFGRVPWRPLSEQRFGDSSQLRCAATLYRARLHVGELPAFCITSRNVRG